MADPSITIFELMNRIIQLISLSLILSFSVVDTSVHAGNPDRQGEAGAYELLLNPWARSAGLHTLNVSMVSGVEAMRVNVAGMGGIRRSELAIGHARYLEGTGIAMNAVGLTQRVGENGVFGLSLMAMSFGDIDVTTTNLPGGDGTTYSPSFFNLGLGYSHTFENKVSVGVLVRAVSETIASVSAFGVGFDAGVQYVTGPKDNFKFGVSMRNIGLPMKFGGEGLSFQGEAPNDNLNYDLTLNQRAAQFEIPSLLHIGVSYDFYPAEDHRLTILGNFTANSFSRDIVGGGAEYAFREMFFVRGAYRVEFGNQDSPIMGDVYTGLAGGFGVYVNPSRRNENEMQIDYAYRATNPFSGTHNITLKFNLAEPSE
jgi:hypothetical protein